MVVMGEPLVLDNICNDKIKCVLCDTADDYPKGAASYVLSSEPIEIKVLP